MVKNLCHYRVMVFFAKALGFTSLQQMRLVLELTEGEWKALCEPDEYTAFILADLLKAEATQPGIILNSFSEDSGMWPLLLNGEAAEEYLS